MTVSCMVHHIRHMFIANDTTVRHVLNRRNRGALSCLPTAEVRTCLTFKDMEDVLSALLGEGTVVNYVVIT